jgi:hypothetical protein
VCREIIIFSLSANLFAALFSVLKVSSVQLSATYILFSNLQVGYFGSQIQLLLAVFKKKEIEEEEKLAEV